MAWSAPANWSVSEVVVASKMNAQIRDNLSYLKGLAGAIYLQDNVGVTDATASSDWAPPNQYLTVATAASPGLAGIAIKGARAGADAAFAQISGVNLSATGADKTGGAILFNRDGAADSASVSFQTRNAGTVAERMRIDHLGNVGIGQTAPAGRLHVTGGGVTTGGMVIGSVAAVTSIQTVFAAGTVARGVVCIILDRNNTGPAFAYTVLLPLTLSTSTTYTNTDTITIAVTAGGAVTAQRTTGTNGTHDILILALFQ